MKSVIIEGSVTPAVGVLARGERRSCALTPHIQDLIDRGFVNLVEVIEEPKPFLTFVAPEPEPEPEPKPAARPRRGKATGGA